MRVLIADSHRDAADSLGLLLACWGYEAAVAYDGAQALRAARAHRPRVVLSELVLPGLDGCRLAGRLRAELPEAALVAVTTQGRPADRLRSREAGFCGHLVKPADPDGLRALLAALAGWRAGGRTSALCSPKDQRLWPGRRPQGRPRMMRRGGPGTANSSAAGPSGFVGDTPPWPAGRPARKVSTPAVAPCHSLARRRPSGRRTWRRRA
jgi:CheY-like chemotaxis protein